MKPDRYNIFKKTHQCLSSMVYETGKLVRQTDFTSSKDADNTFLFIKQTIRCFECHTEKEAPMIYGALIPSAPFIVVTMEKANERDLQLAIAVENKIREFRIYSNKEDLNHLGQELQTLIFAFSSAVLQLIYKEETVINDLLWTVYDDEQLKELEAGITRELVNDESICYTSRILRWLTNQEIIFWISGLIDHGYPCAAEKMIEAVKSELPIERWQRISQDFVVERA